MKKSGFVFGSLILLAALGANILAQQPAKKNADNCSQFKMRVVSPENESQWKTTVVKPGEGIDYKGKVFNPCASSEQNLVGLPPIQTGPEQSPGSSAPSLRLLPVPESESKVKSQLPPLKLNLIK